MVASASAKESSALAPVSPAKRELPLRAQAPPLNCLQLSVPAKGRVSTSSRKQKASTGSSTALTASLPITVNIQSMSRYTINLSYGPPPESTQEDPVTLPELSEKEVEELFSDF